MPIHQQRLHQRKDPEGNLHLNKNAKNHCGQKRLSSLRSQVQQIREETQKHPSALLTRFHCQGRRYHCDW